MIYHVLMPEVAGGLGTGTLMDTRVHPPAVGSLHYEVDGWLGDDLLESFPCFLISPEAAAALQFAALTGVGFDSAYVTIAPGAEDLVDDRVTRFRWLQATGRPGADDVAVDAAARLVVSDRALTVLQAFRLAQCAITTWSDA
jgi:hypothetical protein